MGDEPGFQNKLSPPRVSFGAPKPNSKLVDGAYSPGNTAAKDGVWLCLGKPKVDGRSIAILVLHSCSSQACGAIATDPASQSARQESAVRHLGASGSRA